MGKKIIKKNMKWSKRDITEAKPEFGNVFMGYGFKNMICLFFSLFLVIPGFCQIFEVDKPFGLEFNFLGLELGGGNTIHILGEGLSLGLSYKILENLDIQLSSKGGEIFLSGFSGDYMFASSEFPLYLSLNFETDENSFFYITGGGNNWSVIYEMPYTSSAIGYKLNLGNFGNFNILYFGCELQWIRVWQSQRKNDIIGANFTFGFGGYRKDFGI